MSTKQIESKTVPLTHLNAQNSLQFNRINRVCNKTAMRKTVTNLQLVSTGNSVHVYKGIYDNKTCVAKELAPIGLLAKGIIYRAPSGRIVVRKTPGSFAIWKKAQNRFIAAYKLNRLLQDVQELASGILPVYDCLRQNGTLYSVSLGAPGTPLDKLEYISPENVLIIGIWIAQMTAIINNLGWLLVDIKPSNYILDYKEGETIIRLTDFDSAVRIRDLQKTKCFMCSNETAAPEVLIGSGDMAGTHSDVYSIAVMILNTLAKHPFTMDFNELFDTRVVPSIELWHPTTINRLRCVLNSALQHDPIKRMKSCIELADGLRDICDIEGFSNESLFL